MIWQQQLQQHLLLQQVQMPQGLLTTSTIVNSNNSLGSGGTNQPGPSPDGGVQAGVPDVIPNPVNDQQQQQKMVTSQPGVMASPRTAHVRPAIGVSGHGPLPPIPVGAQIQMELARQLVSTQQQQQADTQPIYQTLQPTCSCCPRNPHAFPGGGKLARIAQLLPTNSQGRFPNASEIRRRDGLNAYPQVMRPASVIITGSGGHPLDGVGQGYDGQLRRQVVKDNTDSELQQFTERDKDRTKRIKQRYAANDDDRSFGFSKRPARKLEKKHSIFIRMTIVMFTELW